MKHGLSVVLTLVAVLAAGTSGWAACGWTPTVPTVIGANAQDVDLVDDIIWYYAATNGGGTDAFVRTYPVVLNDQTYHVAEGSISCSVTVGWTWKMPPGDDTPVDQATFSLTWGGTTSSVCTVTAKKLDDFAAAAEIGYAAVTSPDFVGQGQKWEAYSRRGAQVSANPGDGQEGKITVGGTMDVSAGLPPTVTGSLQWQWVVMDRGGERSVVGQEASSCTGVALSGSSIEIPEGSTNKTVEATSLNYANASYECDCGDSFGHGIDGEARANATTQIFYISRG